MTSTTAGAFLLEVIRRGRVARPGKRVLLRQRFHVSVAFRRKSTGGDKNVTTGAFKGDCRQGDDNPSGFADFQWKSTLTHLPLHRGGKSAAPAVADGGTGNPSPTMRKRTGYGIMTWFCVSKIFGPVGLEKMGICDRSRCRGAHCASAPGRLRTLGHRW